MRAPRRDADVRPKLAPVRDGEKRRGRASSVRGRARALGATEIRRVLRTGARADWFACRADGSWWVTNREIVIRVGSGRPTTVPAGPRESGAHLESWLAARSRAAKLTDGAYVGPAWLAEKYVALVGELFPGASWRCGKTSESIVRAVVGGQTVAMVAPLNFVSNRAPVRFARTA